MATKAELEAELAEIRSEMARNADDQKQGSPANGSSSEPEAAAQTLELRKLLHAHGIDAETIESLGENLLKELSALQKEKPLLTIVVAFALGLIVGRASK